MRTHDFDDFNDNAESLAEGIGGPLGDSFSDHSDHLDDHFDEDALARRSGRSKRSSSTPRRPNGRRDLSELVEIAGPQPARSGRLTEQERARLAAMREEADAAPDLPDGAARWTTWAEGEHGPRPRPDWLVTELSAADTELGVLKTGKEAEVHLIRRAVPDTDRECLLAAKRYRTSEHRLFHRDAGYLEGRRMRRSREMRAMATRTSFGRNLIAEQWAVAEFAALARLWSIGAPVPYPAQRVGTELLLEYLGDADGAAPRLVELRPDQDALADLWRQLVATLELLAERGIAHGDLSAYNLLVHDGRLMLIDLPQVVDIVANPRGTEFLARDVTNIATWFAARGLPESITDPEELTAHLCTVAGLG